MKTLENGTKVRTNKEYFEKFGRTVIGTVDHSDLIGYGLRHIFTRIIWEQQTGNVVDDHQGERVVMLTSDLEEVWKCVITIAYYHDTEILEEVHWFKDGFELAQKIEEIEEYIGVVVAWYIKE